MGSNRKGTQSISRVRRRESAVVASMALEKCNTLWSRGHMGSAMDSWIMDTDVIRNMIINMNSAKGSSLDCDKTSG